MAIKTFKIKPILGALPEGGAIDWWTKEDWDKHNAYVEQLKKDGLYLTEGEELTFDFTEYNKFISTESETSFSNFGIIMPKPETNEKKA